ncbi:amino acid adenylation domain-containing protein, partial [Amycolatopsis sp. NPDC000746]|uniref:amino acid adenylation domain-containing protein n=1 Tax=Amycolatopsis sp. NPDC000746 TaxID=3154270 RepID=UPI00332EDA5B
MTTGAASTLAKLVAARAATVPRAAAVLEGDETTSYAALAEAAERVAARLHAHGLGPESRLGVCLPRSALTAAALLAVWRAGGAFVPLDADHPADRLAWTVRDADIRVVLTVRELAPVIAATGAEPLCVDEDETGVAECPAVDVHPHTAAYVIYTSGSTGRPKGVVVPHQGIANRVMWAVHRHSLAPGDRVLHKTALTFDASVWEVFAPLICGATVVMAPPGAERDPATLVDQLVRQRITVLQTVPSVLRLLVREPAWSRAKSLRLLFCAGEPLHAQVCRQVFAGVRPVFWNTYGPTECSVDVTAAEVEPAQETGPIPIGRPLPNVRVQVLAPDGQLAPVGSPGELHVAGIALARGYLGRPDLTAERFLPDPYGPPGSRRYRTGDQVRWRPNGELEYLGRLDHQLKVNGVRVEAGEVEAALTAHPGIADAAVAVRDGRLVGYYVSERDVDPASVRACAAARLPSAMVPAAYLRLTALPLTTSGKIDRAALPEPARRTGGAPLCSELEHTVAVVWTRLLERADVAADDDFFALGGSSLELTRLASELRAETGVDIPIGELFAATTVSAQAELLARLDGVVEPIPTGPRGVPRPLSSGQRRLWFLDRMRPGDPEWTVPLFIRLPATVGESTARRALAALVARHEVLRTRYLTVAGEPMQMVEDDAEIELRVAGYSAAVAEELKRPFDLSAGRVMRGLLTPAGDETLLLLTFHHISCDGASTVVIERELRRLCAHAAAELGDPGVRYADYATWQQNRLTDETRKRELGYWRSALDGVEPLDLPTDRPRPAERDSEGGLVSFTLPPRLVDEAITLGRGHGATPFTTLLTVFAMLLAKYTGQRDIPIGTPVGGRHHPDLADVVGFFLNMLVLRCDLAADPTFREALARTRATAVAALGAQTVPFEEVVEAIAPERDLSRTPLYQVSFDLHEQGRSGTAVAADDLAAFAGAWRIAKTDLTLIVQRREDGGMDGVLEYATALFDRDTAERMVARFQRLVEAAVAQPDAPMSALSLLDDRERAELTGPPPLGRPVADCLHEVFEQQVRRRPDAGALSVNGRRLTYRELNERANRLAHHLLAHGIGPGCLVAVHLERGPDLVPALLGVLKAGAGYLPVDPAQPTERVRHILADAEAAALIADEPTELFAGPVIVPARDAEALAARPDHDPEPAAEPGDIAYVVYTSGSSGRPKGVGITHAQVARLFDSTDADFEFRDDDVWTMFHSYAFDFSVWELWGALLHGGRVVVVPQMVTRSPAEFLDLLVDEGVTMLSQTPSAFSGLVALAGDDRIDRLALRAVVFGGEKLEVADLLPWVRRVGLHRPRLVNMYGITETTVHATCRVIGAADLDRPAASPIG